MSKQKATPEDVREQIRAVRSQIEDDVTPMTAAQRRGLRDRTKHSHETIAAATAAIGMSEKVSGAIGLSKEQVDDLIMLVERWKATEGHLRELLNGVSSANLARRRQLALIADHVFAVTKQLVRWPENGHLIPIYEEMQELRKKERKTKRRKVKEAPAPEDPKV